MKKLFSIPLVIGFLLMISANAAAQNFGSVTFPDDDTSIKRGYYDRAYKRYEAEPGKCESDGNFLPATSDQREVQSEASNQVATQLTQQNSYVQWKCDEAADGMVIRFSIPDGSTGLGTTGKIALYVDDVHVKDIKLDSYWAWQHFFINNESNKYPDNNPNSTYKFPRMRFDDVRVKLDAKIPEDAIFKLVKVDNNSTPYTIDFVELEPVPDAIAFEDIDDSELTKVKFEGTGGELQDFIDANGGKIIYLKEGVLDIPTRIYISEDNTQLIGAGMWYTQLDFSTPSNNINTYYQRGIESNSSNIVIDGLYITTINNQRYYQANSSRQVGKALMGSFGSNSVIQNVWAEHFECGAWIADYSKNTKPQNLLVKHCRFRNNYADGINLCVGSTNCIVEHCSFRNNGDDDMASWSSEIMCENNTYRYCTAEHNWRASSLGFFGGKNNKAHNCVIMDGLESGLRINSDFGGTGFGSNGFNEFHDISIYRCGAKDGGEVPGTHGDLWGRQSAAIYINSSWAYLLQNVKFSNINIYDSRQDAIQMQSGSWSVRNLSMEDIYIDGAERFGIFFVDLYGSNNTYCNIQFENIGAATSNMISTSFNPKEGCEAMPPVGLNNITDTKDGIIATAANGTIRLSNVPEGQKLNVYNLLGSTIYQISNTKTQETITGLPEGIYFISVGNNKAASFKILVTK